MTKDEIIRNKIGVGEYVDMGLTETHWVMEIMDEWAKQQAIAFLKRHIVFTDESMYEKSYSNFIENQFIEQQNKP